MNHSKRLLKIAEKILADVHFSTQQEFDEYLKNHPNYREDTKFYVNGVQVKTPPREKKKNDSSEMTDEQKKLHQMAMSKDYDTKELIARHKETHPVTLDMLADCSDEDDGVFYLVHYYVARNPNTSSNTLHKLRLDENNKVRETVARNSRTSSTTLESLSKDKNEVVRREVAFNENTPPETLEKMSDDYSLMVNCAVSGNKKTPLKTLEKMSEHHHPVVRYFVYHNDEAPKELKEKILSRFKKEGYSEKDFSNMVDSIVYSDLIRY